MASFVESVVRGLSTLAVIGLIVLLTAARCSSWFSDSDTSEAVSDLEVVEFDPENERHAAIASALALAWIQAGQPLESLDLLIAESPELNAASFGGGAFLFWSGVGGLPVAAIEAIAAHEVAHDVLLHSRRAQDLSALMNFVAEAIGLLGGADPATEDTLRDWLHLATLPRYSRSQELSADAEAVNLLERLGYEMPEVVFAEALEILHARYGDTGGGFVDSHPAISERIGRIRGLSVGSSTP